MIKHDLIEKSLGLQPSKVALEDDFMSKFNAYTNFAIDRIKNFNSITENSLCAFISRNTVKIAILGAACSSLGCLLQEIDYHLNVEQVFNILNKLNTTDVFVSNEFINKYILLNDDFNLHVIEDLFLYYDDNKII